MNERDVARGTATIRAFVARETERAASATAARVASRRALLPAMVERLRALGAERIWLFGSLAQHAGWGAPSCDSDIDLAVEGLPADRFFAAYGILWDLAGEPVDLVALEDAAPELRQRILSDGEVLR